MMRLLVAIICLLALSYAASRADDHVPAQAPNVQTTQPAKTGKERLSDKASDEQRVDNCKVPPDRRGTKVRPDNCPAETKPIPTN